MRFELPFIWIPEAAWTVVWATRGERVPVENAPLPHFDTADIRVFRVL